ncbi:MAG: YncE family protein [bacterium]
MRTISSAILALVIAANTKTQVLVDVSNEEHHAALVNPYNQQIFAKLSTGRGPHEIALSPRGELAYIANSQLQHFRAMYIAEGTYPIEILRETFVFKLKL